MDIESIKSKVNNYESCSIDEIEEILNFIADRKRQELGIDFEFETIYDTGGCVRPDRTDGGLQQVEIGYQNIVEMKDNKEMKRLAELGQIDIEDEIPEVSTTEERKEFIELILATHHELRHVKQNNNLQDNPISNEDNIKMTREHVINHSFTGFINAYNYEQSMIEIDAIRASLEETVGFFQEMGSDITPDEVFAVMKEKELSYLGYDLSEFGDSYESAMEHFDHIYGKTTEIKGIPEIVKTLPEDKKEILFGQCQDLMDRYNAETDMDKRMELLESMSLRMSPELKEKYPLAGMRPEKEVETDITHNHVNEREIEEPQQETGFRMATLDDISINQQEGLTENKGQETEIGLDSESGQSRPSFLDKVGTKLDNVISGMDKFEATVTSKIEGAATSVMQFGKSFFEQSLMKFGFNPSCIEGIKARIKGVNPRKLISMDRNLSRAKEKTLSREGIETDGNEQDYR